MATIIKASGPTRDVDNLSYKFDDITDSSISDADASDVQSAELLSQARREADAIRKRAEEEGRRAATLEVEQLMAVRIRTQLESLFPAVKQAAEQLEQAKHAWLAHWEKAAVHVASRIAERVIRRELTHEPQISIGFVREALELAAGSASVQIRMNPQDVATLGPHVAILTSELGRASSTTIVGDPTISTGGCRVETKFGVIDQQIEEQIKRIEEELT